MKHLSINSTQFKLSLLGFKNWLRTLNYSASAIEQYPNNINELFHYLEAKGINRPEKITSVHIPAFIEYIKQRTNQTTGAGLSANHINSIINAVNKYLEYLSLAKDIHLAVEFQRETPDANPRDILTVDEVKILFITAEENPNRVLAKRDTALLAVLYGAGLRKNELEKLDIEDISMENRTIHVRHGKAGKERLIPVTPGIFQYIINYITGCRDIFCDIAEQPEAALFIDVRGKRMNEDNYYNILKQLVENSGNETIQNKKVSLHTFRHSIATHLLQAGMDIEKIARFLGHSSLDSTMIYTHLAEQLKVQGH